MAKSSIVAGWLSHVWTHVSSAGLAVCSNTLYYLYFNPPKLSCCICIPVLLLFFPPSNWFLLNCEICSIPVILSKWQKTTDSSHNLMLKATDLKLSPKNYKFWGKSHCMPLVFLACFPSFRKAHILQERERQRAEFKLFFILISLGTAQVCDLIASGIIFSTIFIFKCKTTSLLSLLPVIWFQTNKNVLNII